MHCKCFDPGPKSKLTCGSRSLQGHRRSAEESKLGSQGAVPESAAAGFVAAAGVADPPLISEAARAPLQPHIFTLRSLSFFLFLFRLPVDGLAIANGMFPGSSFFCYCCDGQDDDYSCCYSCQQRLATLSLLVLLKGLMH